MIKINKFTQWGQLLECKTLTGNQRVILGIILNLHNLDEWDFTPLSVLKERSGIGITTLKNNITMLCNLGLIEKKPNYNRKKSGKAPNDYVPNYTNILDLLDNQIVGIRPFKDNQIVGNRPFKDNQIVGNRPFKDNQIVGNRPFNRSENDHSNSRNQAIRKKEEKKEKKAIIYNNNNLSTRRYMVSVNEDSKKYVKTEVVSIPSNDSLTDGTLNYICSRNGLIENAIATIPTAQDTTPIRTLRESDERGWDSSSNVETENGNPINALLGFDEADERGWDSSSNVETATADNKSTLNGYAAGNDNTNSTETENGNPINALLGFDEAFEKGWDSSTAVETANTPKNDRDEEIIPQVDNYTTAAEKTPQERYLEGNLEKETADEEMDSPNNGANTAEAINTLSIEDTKRIMSQAAQNILKNRKHAAETDDDKLYKAFNASINGANTAVETAKAPKNDRDEEIIPQVDNYTTHVEKTPQERYFDKNGADTAEARPIYNTIYAADEWSIRNAEDSCWQETFEYATTNLAKPSESEIRALLNKIYKDWKNRDEAINAKMIRDMTTYVEYKFQITLNKKKQSNFGKPMHNTNRPTTTEIRNMSVGKLSKNVDILERLELASKDCMVFIDAMNKCIEYLIATRKPTINVCKVWFNALHIIQTNGAKMSDNRFNYACDTMDALMKAIHDCGGEDIMKSLQSNEYYHLFKVA